MLRYDLSGHGDSAPPPALPSLAIFAAQLADLLDAVGVDRCAVAGFSLGGMINRRFALDQPGRVTALAIFNSPHERSPEAQRAVEEVAARTADGGPAAVLDEALRRWFTPGFRAARPEVIGLVRRWVMANDPVIYAQCRQVLASGVTELIRPQPTIAKPTLVMTAENDSGSTPAMARAIAEEIPGAQLTVVPHLQHMALVEAPWLFTEPLLRILDQTSRLA